jgi:beta-N-acetylhexosaminidase
MNNLNKKIAQLICISVIPAEISLLPEKKAGLMKMVQEYQWGGIIVFYGELESTARLIAELQEISEIPLFVCSDLENGAGSLFSGATLFPSNMSIAATRNLDAAYKAGKITAQEAKEIGINVIFAPCVDVNSNPANPIINIRSYGESPSLVSDFSQAFVTGCQIEGVMATAKHFPGHGDTSEDSHIKLPVIKKSRKALDKVELFPFKKIIKDDIGGIMTAHIAVPGLDKSMKPATLSKPVITDLLRNEFGFEGIVFTDALIMGGITNNQEESPVVQAVLAGCDILLMPPDPVKALDEICTAVEAKTITLDIIETAYERIQSYKKIYCQPEYKRDLKRVNSEKNKNFARLVATESVTEIKCSVPLPLRPETVQSVERSRNGQVGASGKIINLLIDHDDEPFVWNTFSDKLKNLFDIDTVVIGAKVSPDRLAEIDKIIKGADLVILSYFSRIRAWKGQLYPEKFILDWLNKNIIANKDVITVTFSNPYLLNKLPGIKDYYCTYSDSHYSQDAIIEVLFKGLKPNGVSPVTLK